MFPLNPLPRSETQELYKKYITFQISCFSNQKLIFVYLFCFSQTDLREFPDILQSFMQFVSRVSVKDLRCEHDYSCLSGPCLTREGPWGLTRTHARTRTRNKDLTRAKAFTHEDLHSRELPFRFS